jgi:hypothetical protein
MSNFNKTVSLLDARKSPSLMDSHKAGFVHVFGQYGRSLELPGNFTLDVSDAKL